MLGKLLKKQRELCSIMSSNSVLNFTNEKIVEKKMFALATTH